MQTIPIRNADPRRLVREAIVDQSRIDAIRVAVESEHSSLRILRTDELLALPAATGRVDALEEFDLHWPDEIGDRTGGLRSNGLTAADWTDQAAERQTTDSVRDFDRPGKPALGGSYDQGPVNAILCGSVNTPAAWLNAGEALSAAWLTAAQVDICLLPLGATVESDNTWRILRRLLSGMAEAFLVLRLGVADPHQPLLPRQPSAQIIEFVDHGNVTASQ